MCVHVLFCKDNAENAERGVTNRGDQKWQTEPCNTPHVIVYQILYSADITNSIVQRLTCVYQ